MSTGYATWPEVVFHPSLHPASLAEDRRRALREACVPARLHYVTDRQAERWLRVHEAHSPARGDAATQNMYRASFEHLAQLLGEGASVQLLGYGCGGGHKDAQLARTLAGRVRHLGFDALDVSPALVRIAAEAVVQATGATKVRRLAVDLENADDLGAWAEAGRPARGVRVVAAFGMVPNMAADALIDRLVGLLAKGDMLALSANLYRPGVEGHDLAAILPQYDNAETRAWLATWLQELDLPVTGEDLRFHLEEGDPARIRAEVTFAADIEGRLEGEPVSFRAGDRLDLFFSNRFTAGGLARRLSARGLAIVHQGASSSGEEGIWLAKKEG